MTSIVGVCDRSLTKAQVNKSISSLSESSAEARACKKHYEHCKREVLSRKPWSFARARIELAEDGTAPVFGYQRRYLLPRKFIAAITDTGEIAEGELYGYKYEIEQNYILTNAPAPLKLRYVEDINDPSLFSDAFSDALAYRLGIELALTLKSSEALADKLEMKYERALRLAANQDARTKAPPKIKTGRLLEARR